MADDIILTPTKKRELEEELFRLRSEDMVALSERIRQARALGDLSENFDYQDAKRQQGFIAGRMSDIQAMLERAVIIEEAGAGAAEVGIGSTVTLKDLDFDDEFQVTVVSTGASSQTGSASVSSPLGKAIFGRKVGDCVEADTPGGKSRLEIRAID